MAILIGLNLVGFLLCALMLVVAARDSPKGVCVVLLLMALLFLADAIVLWRWA